jgi:ABC-2 type transport system ATP-binding protein
VNDLRATTLLEFRGIEKSYGDTPALRGVSFDVHRGEVFGLLGPNGAGKTTLIRILMDILRADAGSIAIDGQPHRREHLDRIGYLPEERGLYAKHKVLDVMRYFGVLKGLSRADAAVRARDWLRRVELSEVAGWKVERLSKGMAQKVQIAATLFTEPELCVLDEPFSGLDPVNVRLVQELIRERQRAGRTTILSAHQMNLVEAMCDRVALIHRGELMVYGEVAEVRARFSPREVRVKVEGELPQLAGVERSTSEGDSTWRLLLVDDAQPQGVLAALVGAGVRVERFEKILAPMDEIFVHVVRGGRVG